jgi:hypothetical protein
VGSVLETETPKMRGSLKRKRAKSAIGPLGLGQRGSFGGPKGLFMAVGYVVAVFGE